MENIRNRMDFRMPTTPEAYEKLVAKPNYNYTTYFGGDETSNNHELAAVHLNKTE